MTTDFSRQRLLDSISLVPHVGERRRNELCVMSLVALLAGEPHSDRPQTACPVIAAYAIKINDAIDCDTRQTLKLFAPRIIGTRDHHARGRAWLLANAILSEALPRLARDGGHEPPAPLLKQLRIRSADFERAEMQNLVALLGREAATLGLQRSRLADLRYLLRACARGSDELVANACAMILSDYARHAVSPEAARWYWNKAVELVDRICDIGDGTALDGRQIEHRAVAHAAHLRSVEMYGPLFRRLFKRRGAQARSRA